MKPMTFEEWYNSPDNTFGACWDAARIGMIPEDEAIRIPPESEWPEGADGIRVHYTFPHVDYAYGTDPIKIIPRSKPAWVPKVGEPVFVAFNGERQHYVGLYRGITSNAYGVFLNGDWCAVSFGNIKPFNPAYIGKPWSEIPEGRNGN